MANQHTPGPWLISWNTFNKGEAHGIYQDGELDLKGYQIATVNVYATLSNNADENTGKANAHLIAAAPDLLEALTELLKIWDYMNISGLGLIEAEAEQKALLAIKAAKNEK